jgi:hypothetical protein
MQAWVAAALGAAMLAAGGATAQEAPQAEAWEPASTMAMAITGRVTLAPDRITFGNRASLPLEPAGEEPNFMAEGQRVTATLYRVTEPANPVLLRGSRLCGNGRPVRSIAVWQPPPIGNTAQAPVRSLAAFSGQAMPKGADDPDNCGTFTYDLPRPRGRR